MNRNKLIAIGVLAMIVAGIVTVRIFQIVQRRVAATAAPESVQVVTAARRLEVGATIGAADLQLTPALKAQLPSGVFFRIEELAGRGVVVPVEPNEVLLASKLAAPESGSGLPSIIPPGMRAVSVRVNEVIAVAGFVVPGTRVDVLLTGQPQKNGDASTVTTTTVLQNVQVLAAGQKIQRDAGGQPQSVPVITLLVTPEDAHKLTLASLEGRIQLALRNPLDVEKTKAPGIRNASLYYDGIPARPRRASAPPPPPPPSMYTVEVIRGDKRDVRKF